MSNIDENKPSAKDAEIKKYSKSINDLKKEIVESAHLTEKMEKIINIRQLKGKLGSLRELVLGRSKKQKTTTKNFWGKSFSGILVLFLLYSFILIALMNLPKSSPLYIIFNILTFGNNYVFGISMVFTYLILAIFFCNTKFKEFLFGDKTWVKQIFLIIPLLTGNFILWQYLIVIGVSPLPVLFILAMFWLIFQGMRLYFDARGFSTRLEGKILKKYSSIRNFFVLAFPFFIVILLTTGVWIYRWFLVIVTLDTMAFWAPKEGLIVYSLEMNIMMPFLYSSIILIFVLIGIEFYLTRSKSGNRRTGAFDNFTYSLIVFFMFIYLIYQITLFFALNGSTFAALNKISANITTYIEGNPQDETALSLTSYLFIIEFLMTMVFLLNGILKTKMNILFLNRDAMVMVFLTTIMAQTVSRVRLNEEGFVASEQLNLFIGIVTLDHLVIPIIIMLFLGLTIVIYYLRPQAVSLFMRIAKEAVDEEDKAMDIIKKFLRREFIRRGESFPLSEVEEQLLTITNLQKGLIVTLIQRIAAKDMDVQLNTQENEKGESERIVDFLSITEKYQTSKDAAAKTQKYMTNRLVDTLSHEKGKIVLTKKKVTNIEERGSFLSALDKGYSKRRTHDKKMKTVEFGKELLTLEKEVDVGTIDLIYSIVKNEFIYRVKHLEEFTTPRLQISDIAGKVFETTRISPGILYPLLGNMTDENANLILIDIDGDLNTIEDKYIDFSPVDDFEVYDILLEYRPERLLYIKNVIRILLIQSLSREKKGIINNISLSESHKNIDFDNYDIYEEGNFSENIFYFQLMDYFSMFYEEKKNFTRWSKNYTDLRSLVKIIKESNDKSREIIRINQEKKNQ